MLKQGAVSHFDIAPYLSKGRLDMKAIRVTLVVLFILMFSEESKPTLIIAQDGNQLRLVSQANSIAVGEEWTVQVVVQSLDAIYGIEGHLGYDPTKLEAVSITQGDFLSSDSNATFVLQDHIDNSTGTIDYAVALRNPAPPVQGQGVALNVTFRAKMDGELSIWINKGLFGTQAGEEILPTLQNIEVSVVPENTPPILAANERSVQDTLPALPTPLAPELPINKSGLSDPDQNRQQIMPNDVETNQTNLLQIWLYIAGFGISIIGGLVVLGAGLIFGIGCILFWFWTIGKRENQLRRFRY